MRPMQELHSATLRAVAMTWVTKAPESSTPAASTSRRTTSSTWAVLPFFLGLPLMATIFINFPSIIWFPPVVPPL